MSNRFKRASAPEVKFEEVAKIENISTYAVFLAKNPSTLSQNKGDDVPRLKSFKDYSKLRRFLDNSSRILPRTSGERVSRKDQKLHERAIKHLRYLGFIGF